MLSKFLHTSSVVLIGLSFISTGYAGTAPGSDNNFKFKRDHSHTKVRMLQGQNGPLSLRDTSSRPLHEKVANQFAPQFGIRNPGQQLRVKKQRSDNARTHLRYGQLQQGLPVIGGELVANLNQQNQLVSMSGETSSARLADTTPTISAEQASQTAIRAVAKWYQLNADQLVASTPVLSVYDPSLLMNTLPSATLVWQVNVAPNTIAPINEMMLVDAKTGGIVLHFNEVDSALLRETRDAGNDYVLPGALICTEATDPCNYDADADAAHDYARDTYEFYFNTHGRDSINGSGMMLTSTVHFGPAAGQQDAFQNAFWIGSTPFLGATDQMVYGDGFALADDVVAHELTHGVTDRESNLFYFSESGAINESLSDVWGEFVDQTNSAGTDGAGVNWQLGEDLPAAIGVVRNMSNPGLFGDPDRMTSSDYYIGSGDNGGVHTNSGVNNKAVTLMVDGGAFNGQTITGIGITKVAHIYYEAQTNLLTTGSDYLDLYNAINTACSSLVGGASGIIAGDCTEVNNALLAVEMNQPPNMAYAPSAEICPVGINVIDLFLDNFEANNLSNWTVVNTEGNSVWSTGDINLGTTSGSYTALASGTSTGSVNDSSLQLTNAVRSPTNETAYAHFDHAFYFEEFGGVNYDGGVIEYSIDNGSNWLDASSLIEQGRSYTGELAANNPEAGRSAFASYSNGFNSTRLNLSTLAGNFIHFRFRSLSGEIIESAPWAIDNFRVYLCANNAPPIPNAGPDQNARGNDTVTLAGSVSDPDGDPVTYQWTQISGPAVTLSDTSLTPSFTAPTSTGALVFELSATSNGVTETDTVNVTINFFFTGSTGGGNGCSLGENGRFDPIWLLLLLFLTGLHLRNRQRINNQD